MNIAKPSAGAVVETIMQMSFGSAVTYVRSGSMENV